VRNQEAARYARWAAFAAVAISLLVVGVYVQRAIRRSRAFRALPAMVASSIQQQSANFTYSDVEQGRTIFTVRASRATQFKDQNRALLEDVWISVYGREGNRNDNIHTRQCNYEPLSGAIRCEGDVQIDLQAAPPPNPATHSVNPEANSAPNSASSTPNGETLRVRTRDLSFNRGTGEASTPAPADFTFAQGKGHAVGISYNTHDSVIRLEHAVTFDLNASDRTGGLPVNASGSSLEIQRNQHLVVLSGLATLRQGNRELSAGKISIALDQNYRAQKLTAEQSPSIHGAEGTAKFILLAKTFGAMLQADGAVESLVADGSVMGARQSPAGADRFSAAHVEVAMLPTGNLLREINATGGVAAQSQQTSQQVSQKGSHQDPQQNEDARSLKTEALRVVFAPPAAPLNDRNGPAPPKANPAAIFPSAGAQRIESVETLAPATLESKTGNETTELGAQRLIAQFNGDGHLDKLFGHSGVTLRRQIDRGTPQLSSASELVATLAPGGEWDTLDETGNVRFQEADRQATAAHATASRSTGSILLEGSPVLADSMSRTTAGRVEINQQTGDIHATGGIVSTYLAAGSSAVSAPVDLGAGPAHISSDTLSGSGASGHVIYSGGARLWQGNSSLNSDRIEIWRDDKKLQASGHVLAAFPQSSGIVPTPSLSNISPSSISALKSKDASQASEASPPGLWQVHAPLLTYSSESAKAHLEGGVTAVSSQGSLQSRTLDVFLNPAQPDSAASLNSPLPAPSAAIAGQASGQTTGGHASKATGGHAAGQTAGELTRLLAQGNVIVLQGDRRGAAEQAEYTAADQKFVLSGGRPTITDAQTDTTTTGASLTFFVASDTISIDSQNGLRTLTKHRVAK
jgi:lipopolysaccharide export system protein LptA